MLVRVVGLRRLSGLLVAGQTAIVDMLVGRPELQPDIPPRHPPFLPLIRRLRQRDANPHVVGLVFGGILVGVGAGVSSEAVAPFYLVLCALGEVARQQRQQTKEHVQLNQPASPYGPEASSRRRASSAAASAAITAAQVEWQHETYRVLQPR